MGKYKKIQKKLIKKMVNKVATKAEFDAALKANAKVVVDFFATWCGPCVHIAPVMEKLSQEYTGVHFLKVDVDENEETASSQGIEAMPTFKFFHNGEKSSELVGSSEQKLRAEVEK